MLGQCLGHCRLLSGFFCRNGGLQRGLFALEGLLWAAGLPLTPPYAAMAAVLRWQLRSNALCLAMAY